MSLFLVKVFFDTKLQELCSFDSFSLWTYRPALLSINYIYQKNLRHLKNCLSRELGGYHSFTWLYFNFLQPFLFQIFSSTSRSQNLSWITSFSSLIQSVYWMNVFVRSCGQSTWKTFSQQQIIRSAIKNQESLYFYAVFCTIIWLSNSKVLIFNLFPMIDE